MIRCKKKYIFQFEDMSTDFLFVEGSWYSILSNDTKSPTVITDNEKYFHYIGIISKSVSWIRKGYKEEELPTVIPGYLNYEEVKEMYTKEIEVPTVRILSEPNSINSNGTLYEFITVTRDELVKKYGSSKFTTSYKFFEDYFETKDAIRNNTINTLLS